MTETFMPCFSLLQNILLEILISLYPAIYLNIEKFDNLFYRILF